MRRYIAAALLLLGASSAEGQTATVTVRHPASEAGAAQTLASDETRAVRAPTGGVIYFTVDAPFIGEKSGVPVVLHRRLHFVVGGDGADGTAGSVRVNGPGASTGEHRSLVEVLEGWVWVSDRAPAGVADAPAGGGVPVLGNAGEPVGWNLLTLLHGEWSWAGAIGTEFILRIDPDAGGERIEMVYGLDSASVSHLLLPGGEKLRAPGGSFAGLTGTGAITARPAGRWLGDAGAEEFVRRVREARSVGWVGNEPVRLGGGAMSVWKSGLVGVAAGLLVSGASAGAEPADKTRVAVWPAARPAVQLHFPRAWGEEVTVADNTALSVRAVTGCVAYFTVRADFLSDDTDPTTRVHDLLHFVVGGYPPDGTTGRLRVNGVETDENGVTLVPGQASLIAVENGWVWVSDCPPPNWSGEACDPSDCAEEEQAEEGATLGVFGQPQAGVIEDEWVSWSILTLLKAEWTWAGAVGTEFVYRVEPYNEPGKTGRTLKVYGLSGCEAVHTARAKSGSTVFMRPVEVRDGFVSRAITDGQPEAPNQVDDRKDDRDFMEWVRARLAEVVPGGSCAAAE